MRVELNLPHPVGETLEPATVCRIYHGPSEPVSKGEPVLEMISGDGIFDLEAPRTGIVVEIRVKPGEKVYPGCIVLVLECADEPLDKDTPKPLR